MARARIVVGTTAVGAALNGPVQDHGARSYSRNGGAVKAAGSVGAQNPATLPWRSYSSARSIFAVTISPTFRGRRLDRYTAPSISGASAFDRPLATVGPTSSTITCWREPTLRLRRRAEILRCRAISAFQRSCFTSSGTGWPIASEV